MIRSSRQGAVAVLVIEGSLNADQGAEVRRTCEALRGGAPLVVFDLSQTPLFDSAGLESLLAVHDQLLARGGQLKLSGPNPLCRDILRVTGVDQRFEIFDDAKRCVGSFAR